MPEQKTDPWKCREVERGKDERDSQRSKLYRAEERAFPKMKTGPHAGLESVADVERFLARMVKKAWFVRRFGAYGRGFKSFRLPRIGDGRGRRAACGSANVLKLPPWSRTRVVVLHEFAHCLNQRINGGRVAGHGWQFAAIYVELVRFEMGKEAADKLKAEFKAGRVRWKRPRKKRELSNEERAAIAARLKAGREAKGKTPKPIPEPKPTPTPPVMVPVVLPEPRPEYPANGLAAMLQLG